jgi:hypothetical protein
MISDSIRIEIRQRAEFKCEFCGISEIEQLLRKQYELLDLLINK